MLADGGLNDYCSLIFFQFLLVVIIDEPLGYNRSYRDNKWAVTALGKVTTHNLIVLSGALVEVATDVGSVIIRSLGRNNVPGSRTSNSSGRCLIHQGL